MAFSTSSSGSQSPRFRISAKRMHKAPTTRWTLFAGSVSRGPRLKSNLYADGRHGCHPGGLSDQPGPVPDESGRRPAAEIELDSVLVRANFMNSSTGRAPHRLRRMRGWLASKGCQFPVVRARARRLRLCSDDSGRVMKTAVAVGIGPNLAAVDGRAGAGGDDGHRGIDPAMASQSQ
jgi:hypothetical protein